MGTLNTNKGGRKRTGTVEPHGTHPDGSPRFRFRVRLGDGTKSERFDVPHGLNMNQARQWVAGIQAEEDAKGLLLAKKLDAARSAAAQSLQPHTEETWDAWFARYMTTREGGPSYQRITAAVASKWISPVIGSKVARTLTRDDVEDVRDKLDAALDAKQIRSATARNVWSILTGALKAAYAARERSLRIHSAPLHFGILPPKRGTARQRAWIYPREWETFANCSTIPVVWRQAVAIALYTGLRPGEAWALTWSDVDVEARTVTISKAFDEQTGETKAPKTARSHRVIPIHPELVPLLAAIEGEPGERVVALFDVHGPRVADAFRGYLAEAGLDRPRLTADTDTEERVDFRSLRDSHATWLAIAGLGVQVIQRRLGHSSPTVTDRYCKVAETFSAEHIGAPFPPIPREVWTKVRPSGEGANVKRREIAGRNGRGIGGVVGAFPTPA